MEEIDKKIREYYQGKSLSKDQLQQITSGNKIKTPLNPWKSILKYAAVITLIGVAFWGYQSIQKNNLLKEYAKVVAYNHHKGLDPAIKAQSVSELNSLMNKLNFEIEFPQKIHNNYALLGGRYCSIDERMAAQLKIQNKKTNQIETLYVLAKIPNDNYDNSFLLDSTSVHIWNSQTNLFVLASN